MAKNVKGFHPDEGRPSNEPFVGGHGPGLSQRTIDILRSALTPNAFAYIEAVNRYSPALRFGYCMSHAFAALGQFRPRGAFPQDVLCVVEHRCLAELHKRGVDALIIDEVFRLLCIPDRRRIYDMTHQLFVHLHDAR